MVTRFWEHAGAFPPEVRGWNHFLVAERKRSFPAEPPFPALGFTREELGTLGGKVGEGEKRGD